MTRRERIVILLENYLDALEGLRLKESWADGGPVTMSECWNHPSYQELERLRIVMRDQHPFCYWHLAETYFRHGWVRVAYCPKCETEALKRGRPVPVWPADMLGKAHSHKPKSVDFQPRMRKVVSAAVKPELVQQGIDWLDGNWARGDASLPEVLLAVMARGEKDAA